MARKPLTEEERVRRRAYMRNYNDRGGALPPNAVTGSAGTEPSFSNATQKAAYLPGRDPPLRHESLTAALMGDPPVGRRALDKLRGEG